MALMFRASHRVSTLIVAMTAVALPICAQTSPSDPAPATEATPPTTASTDAKPAVERVHPAFFATSETLQAAITRGREFAKKGKSIDDLLKPYRVQPYWTRGKGGSGTGNTKVYCYSMDGMPAAVQAFDAERLYKKLEIPDDVLKNGAAPDDMHFWVSMLSTPKQGRWRWSRNRNADPDAVTVQKFVLTDDKGNVLESARDSTETELKVGTQVFSGVAVIPHVQQSHTDSSANASAWGSGGSYAYGTANGTSNTTTTSYTYAPWSQGHPYYECSYEVVFPMRDSSGKPTISPDAREIKLHIITPVGEQTATYKMPKPKTTSK